MKYSKATNYALHTMLFLAAAPDKRIGVQRLAERQEVEQTIADLAKTMPAVW